MVSITRGRIKEKDGKEIATLAKPAEEIMLYFSRRIAEPL